MFSCRQAIRAEVRALWQLAWPMLVGQVAMVGIAVVDVVMAGHASAEDLAAVSLGAAIWTMLIVTLIGLMMSINPVVAHHVGAGELGRIPHVVRQSLWKALGVGTLACALTHASVGVLGGLGLEPLVEARARAFLQVSAFAMPAFAGFRALYGYSASLNQTQPMMVISLGALLASILLNWVLVFGHWGAPALGAVGCAVATVVCVWGCFLAMVVWICRARVYRPTFPFDRFEGPNSPTLKMLLGIGLPIGVTYFAEASAFSVIALLVAHFGTVQVAAHQVALNFASLVFMVPMSLGTALITRVGLALGEGQAATARFRAWVGVTLALMFGACSALFIGLLREPIARMYTDDAAVAALAAHLLIFAALFQLFDAAQVSAASAIRGYKVTRTPMLIHLAAFWGLCLPLGCALGLAPGWLPWRPSPPMMASGFWISLIVGLMVAALALLWVLNRLSLQRIRSV